MAGTIVVDRIESDASYASTINVAGQITFSNTVNFGAFAGTAPVAGFYLPTTNNLAFTTASTERVRIDASGNIGIGTSNIPSNKDTVTPKLIVNGAGVAGSMQVVRNTTVGAGGGILELTATRGTDVNSYTILQSGDGVGSVIFGGADGTQFTPAAQITAQVDGTPGANDMPGRLVFSTTADGASTPTERMRLTSAGLLLLGDTSGSAKLEVASPNSPYDNAAIRLRAGTAGINFVQRMAVFISNAITWSTIVRITPSNLSQTWQRGLVTASIAGHTSGVNNGALSQAVYYFDNNDATRTCGVVSAGTGSGTGAPQFRTVMDGNTYVLQVQSSNATNRFDGVADIAIICAGGAGGAQTFSISYS